MKATIQYIAGEGLSCEKKSEITYEIVQKGNHWSMDAVYPREPYSYFCVTVEDAINLLATALHNAMVEGWKIINIEP